MSAKKISQKKEVPQSPFVGRTQKEALVQESVAADSQIETLIALTKQVLEDNKKIKRRLTIMTINSFVRVTIILIPLILGVIYLPAFLKNTVGEYAYVFDAFQSVGNGATTAELLNQLSDEQIRAIIQQLGR